MAVWACGIGGVAAVFGSFAHWVQATLSDRGADLLVVTRSGWDLPPSGEVVLALGLVTSLCVLLADPGQGRRWAGVVPPLAGAAIIAVAASRADDAEPIARTLRRMRLGTFQTENPTVTTGTGIGLWICLAAGVLMLVAGVAWLLLDRPVAAPPPAETAAQPVEAPTPGEAAAQPVEAPALGETTAPGDERPGNTSEAF